MTAPAALELLNPQARITSDRIGKIALVTGARSYLEIGVYDGQTFTNVPLARRVAVDPAFRFDWQAWQGHGTDLHQTTSDDFFRRGIEIFDIIFIDGLHTFEQAFRDFCATQGLAHRATVWIIDDTWPNDAFSIERSVAATQALRRHHGLTSNAWHGDVFRTAFAIHDFFPTFDFRTVTGNGNGQTIVVRANRPAFAPQWNSLETIGRLGFDAFLDHRAKLNPCNDAEALAWLDGWAKGLP